LLFIASILGGLGTPVGLVFLLRVAGDHELMAARPVSPRLRLAGWVVTAVVSIASLAVVMTQFTGG
jgi:Mn2+/Fe2+ NRAMP family transporter